MENSSTGAPQRVAEPRIRIINVRVSAREYESLRHAAEENDLRVSELIREAVNEWVADYAEREVFSVKPTA